LATETQLRSLAGARFRIGSPSGGGAGRHRHYRGARSQGGDLDNSHHLQYRRLWRPWPTRKKARHDRMLLAR
jgi:hypothetical protein